ncbi:MAG: NosD domain-containing protein [Candidatus Thorarchaeota archaeon]
MTVLGNKYARSTIVVFLAFVLVATQGVITDIPPKEPMIPYLPGNIKDLSEDQDHDSIIISSNADFELQRWPGEGTEASPYIISGLEISDHIAGIRIESTSAHFIVEDCHFQPDDYGALDGLYISDATNGVIRNNTLDGCGIRIVYSNLIEVSSNRIRNSGQYGISIQHCFDTKVNHNFIEQSDVDGIRMTSSSQCTFSGNMISDCSIGISVLNGQSSEFSCNSIRNAESYGIEITSGDNNQLYANLLDSEKEAIDNGLSNQWDDGQCIGNYWRNQPESDHVSIPGISGSEDRYPLEIDWSVDWYWVFPIYHLPAFYQFPLPYGETANQNRFSWIIWSYPGSLLIYRNETVLVNRTLEGSGIFSLDAAVLADGNYNYHISISSEVEYGGGGFEYAVSVINDVFVTYPDQPENLAVSVIGHQLNLTWNPPSDDGGNPIVEYIVYRGYKPEEMSHRAMIQVGEIFSEDISNISSFVFYAVSAVNWLGEGERSRCISNYGEHDRIMINGNADFLNQGWPGDGTESNPYNISCVFIQSNTTGISICDVDSYFVISQCWITFDGDWGESTYGIELEDVTNGHIESTTIANIKEGIRIFGSQNCTVVNCTTYGSQVQIYIEFSEYCTIADSHFDIPWSAIGVYLNESRFIDIVGINFSTTSYSPYGIVAYSSDNCSITNCTIDNLNNALQVERCHNLLISHSKITNCRNGISIIESVGITAADCEILWPAPAATGIRFQESSICNFQNLILGNVSVDIDGYNYTHWDHNFSNVSIDGLQVGYFFGEEDISIECTNLSQCFISYCNGVNLTGCEITYWDYGIRIMNSSSVRIQNLMRERLEIRNSSSIEVQNMSVDYFTLQYSNSINLSSLTINDLFMRYSDNCEISMLEVSGETSNFDLSFCNNIRIVQFEIENEPSWIGGAANLYRCFNVTLQGGIYNSTYYNFHIYSSTNCEIIDVHLTYPIRISQSNDSSVINCLLSYDKGTNMHLDHSINATIEDCVFRGGGLEIAGQERHHWYHRIVQNTLNDRPVVYITNESNLEFINPQFGQLILVNCQQVFLQSNHFLNTSYGFQLAYCREVEIQDINMDKEYASSSFSSPHLYRCDQIRISNILFHCLQTTFRFDWCTQVEVDNCGITQCDGIRFEGNPINCVIRNCLFSRTDGVWISDGTMCAIIGNLFDLGDIGIRVYNSDSILIANNNLHSHEGIYLSNLQNSSISNNTISSSSSRGLELSDCYNNLYSGNRIMGCIAPGIGISRESNSTFIHNAITDNTGFGIECDSSSLNLLYGNLLARNGEGGAVDNGINNQWDDGQNLGNCWGFSASISPMSIPGSAHSIDHYPVIVDDEELTSPVIAHRLVFNSTMEPGKNVTEIIWCFWGAPGRATLFVDGISVTERTCSGCGLLTISVLEYGYANYTLMLIDSGGNIEMYTVDLGAEVRALQRLMVSALGSIAGCSIIALVILWDWRIRRTKVIEEKKREEKEREELQQALDDLRVS